MKNKRLFFIACMIVCCNNQAGQDWSFNSPRKLLALCYIALLASTMHNNSAVIIQHDCPTSKEDEYPTTLQTYVLNQREEKSKQNKNQKNYSCQQNNRKVQQPYGNQHRSTRKYDCPKEDQKVCHKNGMRKK